MKRETEDPKYHVFIACPAYDGKVHVPFALSLSDTQMLLATNNINCTARISTTGSLLVAERNKLVQQFWDSGATHMLCIDSDLGWPAQAVLAMLSFEKEVVTGVYPARGFAEEFLIRPKIHKSGKIAQDEKHLHLIGADYVPAGFMLIARSAIEKLRNKFPELYFKPKGKRTVLDTSEDGYCFFNTEVFEGEFWGEDYVFCRRLREAGVDIWVDPLIEFDHAGTRGMLANTIKKDPLTGKTNMKTTSYHDTLEDLKKKGVVSNDGQTFIQQTDSVNNLFV